MTSEWVKLVIAAIFEVVWVVGLKYAHNFWTWTITAIAIYISFYGLIKAGEKLPVGTAYAVFVGLGTAGTVLVDIFVFKQPASPLTLLLIGTLLIGVIGLKMVTDEKEEEAEQ